MSFKDDFEKLVNNPHDAAFKAAFEKILVAKKFFQTYFPEEIVKLIDFEHLELGNKSYVDEKLREKHSDVIYKTKFKDSDAFLYILFEHQSKPDPMMVFRLLCYMVNIWKEYLDQNPKAKCLPVIFPAVLYHGKTRWNVPRNFSGLLEGDDILSEYIPDFTYKVYDLGDYPDEMLMISNYMALDVVLYIFKHISDNNFRDILSNAVSMLAKISDRKTYLDFFEWLLRYTYHARNEDENTVRGYIDCEVEKLNDETVRRLAMTVAEQIEKRGEIKGRTVLIQKLLNKRFGIISPMLEQKLRNSKLDILDQFGENIFDFSNLNDAEKWWETHGTEH
ncbi:Rpn family recombination-promoting nuclease/putative transposase [Desulfobacterales bacterium HSG17]|nr:Rpn family recombination-promoting nuclease/putative transposase [Desulfobacterales bacterium HSG17]